MKFKTLLAISLCASIPAMACAKKPKKSVEQEVVAQPAAVVEEEEPAITEECLTNVSLFHNHVKNKQLADAFDPWWSAYQECPNANKAIYTDGAKIIEWKIANAADEAEKSKWKEILIQSYDKRIKYFGDDPKYPVEYILGQKGVDFLEFYPEDKANLNAYSWLKTSVQALKGASQVTVLTSFMESSLAVYKSNPSQNAEQFISDYTDVSNALGEIAQDPANKNAAAAAAQKDYVDALFAQSGAADCEKLDQLYSQMVEENKANLDKLSKIILLFKRVKCTNSDAYFAASAYAHKLQPTEESAAGCASMCFKKEDWNGAIDYYKQALSLATDPNDEDKPDYLYNIALIYMSNLHNYSEACKYAKQSLQLDGAQGRCYLIIGLCYAAAKPYPASDPKSVILNKTVYWAAVDKFYKAKQVDPSVEETANKYIATYSKHFPSNEDMFDLPDLLKKGGSFFVGGWVGETTTCR